MVSGSVAGGSLGRPGRVGSVLRFSFFLSCFLSCGAAAGSTPAATSPAARANRTRGSPRRVMGKGPPGGGAGVLGQYSRAGRVGYSPRLAGGSSGGTPGKPGAISDPSRNT